MVDISLYFQVHQPYRLRRYSVFDIGKSRDYFDKKKNEEIISRVAKKCYLPSNRLMLDLINETDGAFKVAYSITGTAMEQFASFEPRVIDSFQELADTGKVEFLSETYYHSLAFLHSQDEFKEQIRQHRKMIQANFHQTPSVFRNTELIYNNAIASLIEKMGYKGMLAEGADHVLGWRSPNFVYRPAHGSIPLLLKNYKLSDDIAFRFSNHSWKEFPLTAEKYASWINAINGNGRVVNLFMDYETLGEHQWAQTGIFKFFRAWPRLVLKHPDNSFQNPGEVATKHRPEAGLDVPQLISWADLERDLSAWQGNQIQDAAMKELYAVERLVKASKDKALLDSWRRLQTSDHFYYMCTKYFADGDVHKYFNPYDSPYDCFIAFMNVLNDLIIRLKTGRDGQISDGQVTFTTEADADTLPVNGFMISGEPSRGLGRSR
ncbi:MAG: polysaccharide deacetylase family protein [DPANN group archaeon]|nr:polysaccharide deacetylase family protein [DPANN group archaeon]